MSMPYVQFVASNVKGGVSARLGSKTIIVGPNGSRKSAVINSIELALGGFASDLVGREEVARTTDLAALGPGRKEALWSRAVLSDNSECIWRAGEKGKKGVIMNHPSLVDPDQSFPLRGVIAAIRGSEETARKFFLSFAVPNTTREMVMAQIPEALRSFYNAATMSLTQTTPEVDRLLTAREYARKRAGTRKKAAKSQDEVVTTVTSGLDSVPAEEVIAAVKQNLERARKALEDYDRRRGAVQQVQAMQAQMAPLRDELVQAEQNAAAYAAEVERQERLVATISRPALLDAGTSKIFDVIRDMAAGEQAAAGAAATTGNPAPQSTTCPCCATTTTFGTFYQRAQQIAQYLEAEKAKDAPYQFAQGQLTQAKTGQAGWQAKAGQLRVQLDALQSGLAASLPTEPTAEEYQAAQAERVKYETELARIDNLKAQWNQAKKAATVATDTQKEGDTWGQLEDVCDAAIAKLLGTGVAEFSSRVQRYLPPTDAFRIDLHEGSKEVFRFGFLRGDTLHTTLSGAEWVRATVAMAEVCARPDKVGVVIPPDRSFDPLTLAHVLHAFTAMERQVIITSTVMPAPWPNGDAVPPGWMLIDTTKGQHLSATFP